MIHAHELQTPGGIDSNLKSWAVFFLRCGSENTLLKMELIMAFFEAFWWKERENRGAGR